LFGSLDFAWHTSFGIVLFYFFSGISFILYLWNRVPEINWNNDNDDEKSLISMANNFLYIFI